MRRLRAEWLLLCRWTTEDWMWAFLLVAWCCAAGMAVADPTPHITPATPTWPQIEWRITLGQIGTVIGLAWWVGRWGARQIALLDRLPGTLDRLDARLNTLQQGGCSQLVQHRKLLEEMESLVKDRRRGTDHE